MIFQKAVLKIIVILLFYHSEQNNSDTVRYATIILIPPFGKYFVDGDIPLLLKLLTPCSMLHLVLVMCSLHDNYFPVFKDKIELPIWSNFMNVMKQQKYCFSTL